jgi:hypothetical protein
MVELRHINLDVFSHLVLQFPPFKYFEYWTVKRLSSDQRFVLVGILLLGSSCTSLPLDMARSGVDMYCLALVSLSVALQKGISNMDIFFFFFFYNNINILISFNVILSKKVVRVRVTCLQSDLQTSPPTPQKSHQKFLNPRTTFENNPLVRRNIA